MGEEKKRRMGPKGCAKRIRETAEKLNELLEQAKEIGLAVETDYREGRMIIGEIHYEQNL